MFPVFPVVAHAWLCGKSFNRQNVSGQDWAIPQIESVEEFYQPAHDFISAMKVFLIALGALAKPQAAAPNVESMLLALPQDIKGSNIKKINAWAEEGDRGDYMRDDWDLVESVTPFFNSKHVLSSTSLKSMCGEELRNFMVLHPDCMTSIGTSGKAFWMQMWGEYFLCMVEILDPNTGVNQVKIWRNNGYRQDSSLFKA